MLAVQRGDDLPGIEVGERNNAGLRKTKFLFDGGFDRHHFGFKHATAQNGCHFDLDLDALRTNDQFDHGVFGLGLGEYHTWESAVLSVANERALNSYFPMPFQKHARITVTNEGKMKVDAFYFNLDCRQYSKPIPVDTLYFHAQFR